MCEFAEGGWLRLQAVVDAAMPTHVLSCCTCTTAVIDGTAGNRFHCALQNMARCGGNDSAPKQPRFSLLDGSYHANGTDGDAHDKEDGNSKASTALAKRAQQALQLSGELL